MTEFKKGDIVRLTRGEPDMPGYGCQVREVTYGRVARGMIEPHILPVYEERGWKIELIERPLPTKPNTLGWATVDGRRYLARLSYDQWELYNTDGVLGATPHPSAIEDFAEAALIPKELADKVMEWAGDEGGKWRAGGILQQIADHLKGQDDE
ncbi:hypothetical protein [Brevibacterium luteolum]|uniref:Uncharacterized protein n=1 Tax=Brevibacterium luteolum TaxID=199591 RepID=A0A849ALX2_9MICO|nr:hypothetical protein [Brevibacterium luteolum]MBM7530422.1 hypothetical protein [Brevibacterium luteolum]NNG77819.1 hypothetical protein [Brevibacterium luteolum]